MTETMANGYSSESTQQDLSNGYQHDRVSIVFKDFCIFLPWTKVASSLEGLTLSCPAAAADSFRGSKISHPICIIRVRLNKNSNIVKSKPNIHGGLVKCSALLGDP